ncbi:PAQR family membrane homeostasis protein TrhA [Natronospira bacteriovora]|uniref:Hemolysin III family protein n=1 Tax=Natronospira bacteriovora TaxID=3069753 RepID=A0ABU0W3V4_9GAMM|nr:hemolysin III family protein [Natronospira sp. AB-CW4]MDQ2068639.1 hemolysin III family protein [Natronospira sp. AB-CW4]
MTQVTTKGKRRRSPGEERANSLSHGVALLAILAAAPYLIVHATREGDGLVTLGASIFAGTLAFLYAASTFYHALPGGRFKAIFQKVEHAAILLLIAGTYTPFSLGILWGEGGWLLLLVLWGLALMGIALKIFRGQTHPALFVILYVGMGWLMVIAFRPLMHLLPMEDLIWLLAGGIAYTAGLVFFVADLRLRYAHFFWHLFVIAGSTCHYLAVLWYAHGG